MNRLVILTVYSLLAGGLAGCMTLRATNTEEISKHDTSGFETVVPRASVSYITDKTSTTPFVGIAISGGGSRAANFSLAALSQLDSLGLLDSVDSISSVSGGSLTAALYALSGKMDDRSKFWEESRAALSHDFLKEWLLSMANPINIGRMAFTPTDRTLLMSEIFDKHLFKNATFRDFGEINPGTPRVFLNATSATLPDEGTSFPFTQEFFESRTHSSLASYPISRAVMASGAFPGVFGYISLEVFRPYQLPPEILKPFPGREYIYDGGVADNLGLNTLREAAIARYKDSWKNNKEFPGCLFIAIDSHTPNIEGEFRSRQKNPYTGLLDLAVKPTAWDAINGLLNRNRLATLKAYGQWAAREGIPLGGSFVASYSRRINPKSAADFMAGKADLESAVYDDLGWERYYNPISHFNLFPEGRDALDLDWWPDLLIKARAENPEAADEEVKAWALQEAKLVTKRAPTCSLWHITFHRLLSENSFIATDLTEHLIPVHELRSTMTAKTGAPAEGERAPTYVFNQRTVELEDLGISKSLGREYLAVSSFRRMLHSYVSNVKTNYRLEGPQNCKPAGIQAMLFNAAQILIYEDSAARRFVCDWYKARNLPESCRLTRASIAGDGHAGDFGTFEMPHAQSAVHVGIALAQCIPEAERERQLQQISTGVAGANACLIRLASGGQFTYSDITQCANEIREYRRGAGKQATDLQPRRPQ